MDKERSESVIKVFVDLYNKGLIYRGVRMVNWDPKALTALSDEEVIYKEEHSKLYYLRYKVEDEDKAAYIGITCENVTSDVNQMYGIPQGVYVDTVVEGGPAEKAGIKKEKIISLIPAIMMRISLMS